MVPTATTDRRYTPTEHATWRQFFGEIEKMWVKHGAMIHPFYRDNTWQLQRFRERIPSLAEINGLLAAIGWRCVYVDGYAPPWDIARLLDDHVMPISRSIRSPDEVFFANGPDLIHDIFGHLPSLLNRDYRKLLTNWSRHASSVAVEAVDQTSYYLNKLMVQAQDNVPEGDLGQLKLAISGLDEFAARHPSPSLLLDKTYFWIFEFGLLKVDGELKVLGAGLLSSLSEVEKIALQRTTLKTLDRASIVSPYNISALQDGYLVGEDLAHYYSLIDDMSLRLSTGLQERHYAQG